MAEDWERVGSQLKSDLSSEAKNKWLQSVVDTVAHDMHLSGGQRAKLKGAKFDPRVDLAGATYSKDDRFLGVLVNQPIANFFTVGQLKVILAHEIEHTLQSPELRKDVPRAERDSDFASARTYGAQRALDTLEVEGQIAPSNRDREFMDSVKDPHGTILQRQQAIIDEFREREPGLAIPPARGSDALRIYTLPEDRPPSKAPKKPHAEPKPLVEEAVPSQLHVQDRQMLAELRQTIQQLLPPQDAYSPPPSAAPAQRGVSGRLRNT